MTQPLPIILAASLVAGGAAGVAATVLMSPPASPKATETVVDSSTDVLAALDALRAENRELRERMQELEIANELAPVAMGSTSRSPVSVSESDLKEAIRETLATLDPEEAGFTPTPAMQQVVENVIEMREERERLEREQRRAQAEEERLENRLADLRSDLGLDQNQVDAMRTILQDERARQEEMRDKMRQARDSGNTDVASMRDMWIEMRDTTNQSVQGVLTPAQYEQYQQSQDVRPWGGRRGAAPGGGGPRGRRGN